MTTQQKALELARESILDGRRRTNGVITSAELNDAQVALLQTEFQLQQAKFARIVAAARAPFAAGVSWVPGATATPGPPPLRQPAEVALVAGDELRPGVGVAGAAEMFQRPGGGDTAHLRRRLQRTAGRQALHEAAAERIADTGRVDDALRA